MTYKKQTTHFIMAFIYFIIFIFSAKAQEALPDLFARIKPSVVSIVTYDKDKKRIARGSGFCIATNQIVTNKHVIENAVSIEIHASDNRFYKVLKVLSVDETGDLALLQTESLDSKVKPLALANSSPREGDKIIVVGNPLGLEGSISDGIVSAFRTTRDLGKLIQITAPISPGSSGSPVINTNGEVIGVATLNLEGGQNLNFAISSERLISLWKNIVTISSMKKIPISKPLNQLNKNKEEWTYVGTIDLDRNQDLEVHSFINFSKIVRDNDFVGFWIIEKSTSPELFFKITFPALFKVSPEDYKDFSYLLTYYEGNCKKRESRIVTQQIRAETANKPLLTLDLPKSYKPVTPGSQGEVQLEMACKGKL